jgi:putative oxidoreductase
MKFKVTDRVDLGLLVLRGGIGLMFVFMHGLSKIVGGVSLWRGLGGAFNRLIGISFAPEFWGVAATVSEFGGGLCLIAGVFFRPACGLMLFTMAVAVGATIRGGEGFAGASHPLELGIVLLALFLTGPGKFTLGIFFKPKRLAHHATP